MPSGSNTALANEREPGADAQRDSDNASTSVPGRDAHVCEQCGKTVEGENQWAEHLDYHMALALQEHEEGGRFPISHQLLRDGSGVNNKRRPDGGSGVGGVNKRGKRGSSDRGTISDMFNRVKK